MIVNIPFNERNQEQGYNEYKLSPGSIHIAAPPTNVDIQLHNKFGYEGFYQDNLTFNAEVKIEVHYR